MILENLDLNGRISAIEIQNMFEVSFDTARRDLRILAEKGLLKRTYGGALPVTQKLPLIVNKSVDTKTDEVKDNISLIVQKATSVLEKHDVVFVNDTEIGDLMARYIPKHLFITVVTNSIIIAEQMRSLDNVHVMITGGEIDNTGNCLDVFTLEAIKKMRFDKCFITSISISAEFGLSINSSDSINFLNTIINSSKKSYGLYPAEKIGYESILSICPANKLDVLITNKDAPNDELSKFQEQGVEVLIAESN